MLAMLEKLLEITPLYHPLRNRSQKRKQQAEYDSWVQSGRRLPVPHLAKQLTLREYAQEYSLKILVETGTYRGDMVEALKDDFDRIYSIELSEYLYHKAVKRFRSDRNVHLLRGDSGIELGHLMDRITVPALFWLDGHYSAGVTAKGEKDTPIFEELQHILKQCDQRHVILIDDARCFGSDPAYPSVRELHEFIMTLRNDVAFEVEDDSIRITPV